MLVLLVEPTSLEEDDTCLLAWRDDDVARELSIFPPGMASTDDVNEEVDTLVMGITWVGPLTKVLSKTELLTGVMVLMVVVLLILGVIGVAVIWGAGPMLILGMAPTFPPDMTFEVVVSSMVLVLLVEPTSLEEDDTCLLAWRDDDVARELSIFPPGMASTDDVKEDVDTLVMGITCVELLTKVLSEIELLIGVMVLTMVVLPIGVIGVAMIWGAGPMLITGMAPTFPPDMTFEVVVDDVEPLADDAIFVVVVLDVIDVVVTIVFPPEGWMTVLVGMVKVVGTPQREGVKGIYKFMELSRTSERLGRVNRAVLLSLIFPTVRHG